MSQRGGGTDVRWRSITLKDSYSLRSSTAVQHRAIVFRSKRVVQDLGATVAKRSGCTNEWGRIQAQPLDVYQPWFELLFDNVAESALMSAKPGGPGVTILDDHTSNIHSTGEGGVNTERLRSVMIPATLDYVNSDDGTGGNGPTFILEIFRIGMPQEESIGTIRRPVVKAEDGTSLKMEEDAVPAKRTAKKSMSSTSNNVMLELTSVLKLYHY